MSNGLKNKNGACVSIVRISKEVKEGGSKMDKKNVLLLSKQNVPESFSNDFSVVRTGTTCNYMYDIH